MNAKWQAVSTLDMMEIQFFLPEDGEFGYQYKLSTLHDRALMEKPLVKTFGSPEVGLPMERTPISAEGIRNQFLAVYQSIQQQNTQSFKSGALSGSYMFQEFKDGVFFLHEMLHVEGKMMLQDVEVSIQAFESLSYYFDQVS